MLGNDQITFRFLSGERCRQPREEDCRDKREETHVVDGQPAGLKTHTFPLRESPGDIC